MPVLAGWLTGEHVPQEVIESVLTTMGEILSKHGGNPSRVVQPGMGLLTYAQPLHASQQQSEPPVLDWVPDRRTFIYRRPLSGAHGLYYIEDWPAPGNLLFASEIQALLAAGVPRTLHLSALPTLLHYGCIPAPWTAFKNIFLVPAGAILRWQHAKTLLNTSTDFRLGESLATTTYAEAQERLDTLLQTAVKGSLPTHTQLALLTNGSSSSLLTAALATQYTNERSNTPTRQSFSLLRPRRRTIPFSLVYYGYKKGVKEQTFIEQVAQELHRPLFTVDGVDDPAFTMETLVGTEAPYVDTRPIALHQLLHMTALKNGTRVALTGVGASVLAMNTCPLSPDLFTHRPSISSLFTPEAIHAIQQEEQWEDLLYTRKLLRHAGQLDTEEQRRTYLNLHVWLPDYLVHPIHQLGMAESIAVRSPYLNSEVIDLLTRLPAIVEDGTPKSTLVTNLAATYLPTLATSESSLAFPMRSLHNAPDKTVNELLEQTLSIEALKETGIFNVQEVMALRQQEEASRELLLVFTTQLLYKMFDVSM